MKAIIFDADGVILNTEQLWDAASEELLKKRAIVWDNNKNKHLMLGLSFAESSRVFWQLYNIPGPLEDFTKDRQETIEKFYRQVEFMPGFLDFFKVDSFEQINLKQF